MTTNDVRKLISNNQLQQALTACDQLELPDDFKAKLSALKAAYREYNNHRIDGDMRSDDLEISRAGITKRMLLFLSEYELVCITDLKNNFVELADNIEQNSTHEDKAVVVEEAKQITADLQSIDTAEKKEDVKPGVIKRIGDFIAKFQDKNSPQSKVLSTIKDGVSVVQQIGKKYNSIAQWFMLPQIPTVLL
jgi:effector-associated domain 11 (EAD11)-containing protein